MRTLRIAKVVQMAKRGMLGLCAILILSLANSSSGDGFNSEEGEGVMLGSTASSVCWQRGHGVTAGWF